MTKDEIDLSVLELVACGFASAESDVRVLPSAHTAVLRHEPSNLVLFPPFTIVEGRVVGAGAVLTHQEFIDLASDEQVTVCPDAPFRDSSCFYVPDGAGDPVYVSLAEASSRLADFARSKNVVGDLLMLEGRREEALAEYELAAAAAQSPECYARMLLALPSSGQRRMTIEQALAQVATLDPPSRHIVEVAEQIGNRSVKS